MWWSRTAARSRLRSSTRTCARRTTTPRGWCVRRRVCPRTCPRTCRCTHQYVWHVPAHMLACMPTCMSTYSWCTVGAHTYIVMACTVMADTVIQLWPIQSWSVHVLLHSWHVYSFIRCRQACRWRCRCTGHAVGDAEEGLWIGPDARRCSSSRGRAALPTRFPGSTSSTHGPTGDASARPPGAQHYKVMACMVMACDRYGLYSHDLWNHGL